MIRPKSQSELGSSSEYGTSSEPVSLGRCERCADPVLFQEGCRCRICLSAYHTACLDDPSTCPNCDLPLRADERTTRDARSVMEGAPSIASRAEARNPADPSGAPKSTPPHQLDADALFDASWQALLRKQQETGHAWWVLPLSMVVFGLAALGSWTPLDVMLVIVVLLIHEVGHLVAMRALGYRDTRILFIPFFGAATSGTETGVGAAERAVVSLAGPLPGLALGVVLFIAVAVQSAPTPTDADPVWLDALGFLLLFINGLNFLPLLPLDGGRVVHELVFSRHAKLETPFRLITAVALAALGHALDAWQLTGLGVFLFVVTWATKGQIDEVHALKSRVGVLPPDLDALTNDQRRALFDASWSTFGDALTSERVSSKQRTKLVASRMRRFHARASTSPASAGATIVLLSVYFTVLLVVIVGALCFLRAPVS